MVNTKYIYNNQNNNKTILVECFEWHSSLASADCIQSYLLSNRWISQGDLESLAEADRKNLLIKKLNQHLDGEIHSVVDLSMRDTTGDRGSLCGLAAVYQAGKDTILSISQLKKMSFDDVKSTLAKELGLDPTTVKGTNDMELLASFYSCKCETVMSPVCLFIEDVCQGPV